MDKKKQIAFNLNNFLLATSIALDGVEQDICGVSELHCKRVAYVSLQIGQSLDFNYQEMFDLCAYSLCHSIGLKQALKKGHLYVDQGEENIKDFPFLTGKKDIIKYHNEHYDGTGIHRIKGDDIPLFAQIIALADIVDTKFDFSCKTIENRSKIINYVKENENILFSQKLVNIFLTISSKLAFWLDLQNETDMLFYIFGSLQDFTEAQEFERVLDITSVFTYMLDKDSRIIEHSSKMADFYNFDFKDKETFLIAASMQNIGKLVIEQEILDKTSALSSDEYEIIKSYAYYTHKVLNNIMGFNDIASWASKVQESIDGLGYPQGLAAKDLSLKDRVLAALNVYEALTQKRAYRDAYSHYDAVEILREQASKGKLDISIVEDIYNVFS